MEIKQIYNKEDKQNDFLNFSVLNCTTKDYDQK